MELLSRTGGRAAADTPRRVALAEALVTAGLLVAYNTATNLDHGNNRGYIGRNVAIGTLLLAVARRRGLTWDELGLGRTALRSGLRWSGPIAAAIGGVVTLSALIAGRRPFVRRMLSDRRADLGDRELAWQVLARIPIGTAAFEEIAFRGVLHAMFARSGGWPAALAGSGVAFGLWHVGPALAALHHNAVTQHPAGPVAAAVVSTTVAGVALGVLRELSRHVLPCWLGHWTSNAVGLLAASRSQRRARDGAVAP